jgi:hypothetical protein
MNTVSPPEDEKLHSLLRSVRPAPPLPPRFEKNVWRRIEASEEERAVGEPGLLTKLAGWLLKPKFSLVLATVVVMAGLGLGWNSAQQQARLGAQARYLAVVAPNSLR